MAAAPQTTGTGFSIELSIEIDAHPGTLSGRLRDAGSVQEFVGWLGLLGALGSAIDRRREGLGPG